MTTEMPLDQLLGGWAPGSQPHPWTWDDEELDILRRTCCCRSHWCATPSVAAPGHYQFMLESHILANGITSPVLLGDDGRVWDGHHRIVAARRLAIPAVPFEVGGH